MNLQYYFSYGSNMSPRRIGARVASARLTDSAVLDGHRLAFHKISIDGSGKCDIVESDGAVVEGALFELNKQGLRVLDRHEGCGYQRIIKSVVTPSGDTIEAWTYKAVRLRLGLKPYTWYLEHVIRGARHVGLSGQYIEYLKQVDAIPDPNRQRQTRELNIYCRS